MTNLLQYKTKLNNKRLLLRIIHYTYYKSISTISTNINSDNLLNKTNNNNCKNLFEIY